MASCSAGKNCGGMGVIEINSDRQRLFKLEGSRKEFSQEAPVCVGELGPRFPCFTQLKTPQKRNVSLCRFLVSEQYFIEGTRSCISTVLTSKAWIYCQQSFTNKLLHAQIQYPASEPVQKNPFISYAHPYFTRISSHRSLLESHSTEQQSSNRHDMYPYIFNYLPTQYWNP